MRQQQQPPTLDARISQALGSGSVSADDLHQLIPEVETGIEDADRLAEAEGQKSLDPLASPQDAEQAAQRASVAGLRRDRLKAALPRLQAKLADALRAEHEDRWCADANKVVGRVDAAAEQLARYGEWAELIVAVLAEAEAANMEVERINGSAPDGVHRRISKVALSHLKNLVLPDPDHPHRNLWPPHQPTIAEQYAATMAPVSDPAYSADWAKAREARAEAARAEQQRHAQYYANLTRQQEERQNAEERERFVQSQRRGA